MNALAKIREISKALAASGIETADKEAELLVTHCLGTGMVDLYKINPSLNDKQIMCVDEMAGRRSRREPLQYIMGYSYFMGLKIFVGSGVLIPRPETELMAEHAINRVKSYELRVKGVNPYNPELSTLKPIHNSPLRILDLCTGSGCLALAIAKEFPDAHVLGTDISEAALGYARRNAVMNKIKNIEFAIGHLFEPLLSHPSPLVGEGKGEGENSFDLIISNPPYIRTDDIQTLQPEIRDWEPIGALDGGADGLDFYREIISQAGKFLKTNGILMFELGAGCADKTVRMMKDAGYTDIEVQKDYAGIERIIQARWTN